MLQAQRITFFHFPLPSQATFNTKLCIVSAKKFGVTEMSMETVTLISHATQSRLRSMLEKVSSVAQHRVDSCKVRTNTWAARSRTSKRNHKLTFPAKHFSLYILHAENATVNVNPNLSLDHEDTLVNHTSKTYKGKTFVVQHRTNYL